MSYQMIHCTSSLADKPYCVSGKKLNFDGETFSGAENRTGSKCGLTSKETRETYKGDKLS